MQKRTSCFLGILSALTVSAVQAQADRSVTLNVSQQSVQTALRTLFADAGIRNFVIDADVQGNVNLSLSDVPYSVALKQALGAVSPPLTAEMQDGVTHIRVKPPTQARSLSASHQIIAIVQGNPLLPDVVPAAVNVPKDGFTEIGVKHYDAGMMADLATRPGGLIDVPPNFVIPANSGACQTPWRSGEQCPAGWRQTNLCTRKRQCPGH